MYREFIVPGDHEVLEAIGEWPESEEDSNARLLTLQGEGDERIMLSYDALSRSVRARWKNRRGEEVLDIFHEGATQMTVHSDSRTARILIEFHMGECAGKMEIQALPHLAVTDRLLFI
ncbi:hypothetical protein [Streptomyces sp. Je 1-369]|uniref:hypothetical protein n=1 Tax=Streptomyces sp. Je 1-369 TaxID=2966192 RepID=UPI0022854883|nr:hypothetical protein [Streptomyces sp. Je 1-369]WAL96452.1 hypothetical protein NOO62_19405 [Streptomyces sp. Je 1-369]